MTKIYDFVKTMNESEPRVFTFPNNGVVFDKLPKAIYDKVFEAVEKAREENFFMNHRLVGHIQKEFELNEAIPLIEDFIMRMVYVHDSYFNSLQNYSIVNERKFLIIDPLWVNFQERHEFNPPHGHEGVYSFVIWMKVPYDLENEKNVFGKARRKMASMFGFITSDILGRQLTNPIPVDKDYEGVVCLFPSQLLHYVNPFFTSDEQRISISGNLVFDVKEKK